MHILEKQDCRVIFSALSDYSHKIQKDQRSIDPVNDQTGYTLLIKRIEKLRETFKNQF